MGEVKERLRYIEQAMKGATGFPGVLVREFCYLQLRMLCELVALACLVAHGDITFAQAKRFSSSADEIIKRLTELRPHFYPVATVPNPRLLANGRRLVLMRAANPQPLPKEALLELYGLTHRYVHRGNLKGLISSDISLDRTINAPEITTWASRIYEQLCTHTISCNKDWGYICTMASPADPAGKVVVGNVTTTPP
jgi:hypothetical protein